MPDRFRQFTEGELHELRFGLRLARAERDRLVREQSAEEADRHRLESEIEHEQTQREHAAARQRVIA